MTQVAVPNVIGFIDYAAQSQITGAGLTVGVVTTVANSSPLSSVVTQSPVAGTLVNLGSAVSLVESLGPPQIAVPNVVGLSDAAAQALIIAATFPVGAITSITDNSALGTVLSQSPIGGTLEDPGAAPYIPVALTESLGPASAPVTVPTSPIGRHIYRPRAN